MHASGVILPITTVCSLSLVRYKLSLGIMTLGSELLNARIPPSPPPPLLCVLFLSLSLSLSLSRARARTSVSVSLCLCVSHVSLLVSGGSSLEKVTTITPRISHQATPPATQRICSQEGAQQRVSLFLSVSRARTRCKRFACAVTLILESAARGLCLATCVVLPYVHTRHVCMHGRNKYEI